MSTSPGMKRFENYTSGIYFIFLGESKTPRYIGKSINIFSRVYQHGYCFDYCKYIETINDPATLAFVEEWLIWIFQPKDNIVSKDRGGYVSKKYNKTIQDRFNYFCDKYRKTNLNKPKRLTLDTISKFVYATALELK